MRRHEQVNTGITEQIKKDEKSEELPEVKRGFSYFERGA